jgi:hypothetical protein
MSAGSLRGFANYTLDDASHDACMCKVSKNFEREKSPFSIDFLALYGTKECFPIISLKF